MDLPQAAPDLPPSPRRRQVLLSDLAVHLAEQREAVMRHVLFWMQDQTYYRQRWHRQLAEMPIFHATSLKALGCLLSEIDDATGQFPHGFGPAEEDGAERLSSRLRMLRHEVLHLRKLCGAYVTRTSNPGINGQ